MLDNLFKKYLNVSNYKEHKLYLLARDSSIEALEPKKIADGRIAIYEGYLDGFVIGYVETMVLCQYFGHKKSNFFMLHF